MKNALWIILTLLVSSVCFANTDPVVSNVTANQRTDSSGIVDIAYTLNDPDGDKCTISVVISSDAGSTWTITPSSGALSGTLTNVSNGRRQITWNSKLDLPGVFGTNYRVKVTADDNYGPTGMVWVFINDSGVSGHERFDGYMSKYETTNAQYCQFLNSALTSNQITIYNNKVYATNDTSHSQPYYNLAGVGYTYNGATNGGKVRIHYIGSSFTVDNGFENHPVTYVSWYGATAFCNYYGYRLPTEWEWQAVADYTGSFVYGCGTTITNSMANYLNSSHTNGTTAVGAFEAYGYGMCDMAGNVWEWTSTVVGSFRVIRGGGWDLSANYSTVSYWSSHTPDYSDTYHCYSIGFRVCR